MGEETCLNLDRNRTRRMRHGPGSACVKVGRDSVKDQYCDTVDGHFKQRFFLGSTSCTGAGTLQSYPNSSCIYGYKFSCDFNANCTVRTISGAECRDGGVVLGCLLAIAACV